MFRLFLINDSPFARVGLFRFAAQFRAASACRVLVKLASRELFRGSLHEKIAYLEFDENTPEKTFFVPYTISKSFSAKKAEIGIEVAICAASAEDARVLRASAEIEFADGGIRQVVNQTTYHIENKNVLQAEGSGIAYLGDARVPDISPVGKAEQPRPADAIELALAESPKKLRFPDFVCQIESDKPLAFGRNEFIKIVFSPCGHSDFTPLSLSGEVGFGTKREKFELADFLSDADGNFFTLVQIDTRAGTLANIAKPAFTAEIDGKKSLFEPDGKFACLFPVIEPDKSDNSENLFYLPMKHVEYAAFDASEKIAAQNPEKTEDCQARKTALPADSHAEARRAEETETRQPRASDYAEEESRQMYETLRAAVGSNSAFAPQHERARNAEAQPANQKTAAAEEKRFSAPPAANSGKTEAMELLERAMLMFGDGENTRNANQAFVLLCKASALGMPAADFRLGECYLRGIGTKSDSAKAVGYFKLAANSDVPDACLYYAECKDAGIGCPPDKPESIKYLRRAAALGCVEAQSLLGFKLLHGEGVEKNEAEGISLLEKSLKNGDANATYALACAYYFGDTKPRDFAKAAIYFEIAASAGHIGAKYLLANCIMNGRGVEKDVEKARAMFAKIAETDAGRTGSMAAEALGKSLCQTENFAEAKPLLLRAVENGSANSAYLSGEMLLKGKGGAKSVFDAIELLQFAASRGQTDAEVLLAECQFRGIGFPPDADEAFKKLEKLSKTGNSQAEFLTAMMMITGKGTPKNETSGFALLRASAQKGNPNAVRNLQRLEANNA